MFSLALPAGVLADPVDPLSAVK
ncbi:MAG: hypothetical protein M3461_00860 [Pseudomonadota bacterium]|nr:hypothetical protein [Pseudomonadota bacterium]